MPTSATGELRMRLRSIHQLLPVMIHFRNVGHPIRGWIFVPDE
jgi:hypothetical protein